MTGRDAARDELAQALADLTGLHGTWFEVSDVADATELADSLIELGYRRSVTPDQVREAANAMLLVDVPVPMKMARAAARAFGLEVTE